MFRKGKIMRKKQTRYVNAKKILLALFLTVTIAVGCSEKRQTDTLEASFARNTEEESKGKVTGVERGAGDVYTITLEDGREYTGYVYDIAARVEGLKCLYIKNENDRVVQCWVYPEYYSERYESEYNEYVDENRIIFCVKRRSAEGGAVAQFEIEY